MSNAFNVESFLPLQKSIPARISAAAVDTRSLWSIPNDGVFISGDQKVTHEKLLKDLQVKNQLSSEEDKKLRQACKDFESFFTAYLMKAMDKTVDRDEEGVFADSRPQQFYREMMYDNMAKDMAQRGIGLSEMLYKQVSQSLLNRVYYPDGRR